MTEDINTSWVAWHALIIYEYHGRVCNITEEPSLAEQNHQAVNKEKK